MPISSRLPDVDVPNIALAPFVLERAEDHREKAAIIDGASARTVTYGELAGHVHCVAGGLASRGFAKGATLAIVAPNTVEYAVVFHATTLAGGIVTTINPSYKPGEIGYQLRDSGARMLVTVPSAMDLVRSAVPGSSVEEIFVMGADSFARLEADEPLSGQVQIDPAEDVAVLPYSSGTTGYPKGVMLTHRNLVANLCQAQGAQALRSDDVVIAALPFFHIYGMSIIMNHALRSGATLVTMPRFHLEAFLSNIQERGVTRAYVVPPIAMALAKDPLVERFDLSSLELLICGGAPLGVELEIACARRLDCQVGQGFGMTESSPLTHSPTCPGSKIKPGTIGTPVPNLECRIVELETRTDTEPGQPGELWMRGPNIMKGYLNNESATKDTIDQDGWLHSGDIAIVDTEGYFTIVDRVKELIKYKGFQVAPAELEAVILAHPQVTDAAVISIPDEEAGEVPKAYVVRRGDVSEGDLMAHVAERVASYKRIRAVEFIDEIPKSPSGKILRRLLRDREIPSAS